MKITSRQIQHVFRSTPNQNLYEQNFNQPTNPKKSVTFLIDRTHTSHDFRLNHQDKSFASKKFDIVSNEYKNLVSEKNKEKQREIQGDQVLQTHCHS